MPLWRSSLPICYPLQESGTSRHQRCRINRRLSEMNELLLDVLENNAEQRTHWLSFSFQEALLSPKALVLKKWVLWGFCTIKMNGLKSSCCLLARYLLLNTNKQQHEFITGTDETGTACHHLLAKSLHGIEITLRYSSLLKQLTSFPPGSLKTGFFSPSRPCGDRCWKPFFFFFKDLYLCAAVFSLFFNYT